MKYLFSSMDDLANHLTTYAATARKRAETYDSTAAGQRKAALQIAEAYGYEQAADIVRNTTIKDKPQ